MDPLKGSPAKNTNSTQTTETTTYKVVGELTSKRSVAITGAGAYDLIEEFYFSWRRLVFWFMQPERAGRRQPLPLHREHVSP